MIPKRAGSGYSIQVFLRRHQSTGFPFFCLIYSYTFCPSSHQLCNPVVPPTFFYLLQPACLSCSLFIYQLSVGLNFVVQILRHDRNTRRPCELRICDRCDWHTIDEEHSLLDCPHDHLVRLRTQQQLIFPPQFEDDPARLRTFMNQPNIFGVASFVAKCLALFP